ncbi:hypothetical protein ACWGOQ_0002960 [Aquimarina sp. M1]
MIYSIIKLTGIALFYTQFIFTQESNLSILKNFVGKEWKAEGTWEDGTAYK